jgi:signal transduction histidine kinase
MALLDERGFIVSVNAAWRAATADLKSNWVGARYCEACHELIPDLDASVLRQAVKDLAEREIPAFTHAYTVATARGLLLRQVRISPVQVAGVDRLLAIHEDLDVAARAKAALRKTTEQLLSAQEDERERIAMELHDSTGQHLVAVGLGVAKLQQMLRPSGQAERVLNDMAASLQEAHHEIRVLSYLLRPPTLLEGGLAAAVRRFVVGLGSRTGLHATYASEGRIDPVTAEVEHTAFRVIQEALANVHRHANATSVDVKLARLGDVLIVRVSDDGRGIAALKAGDLTAIAPGVGIAGMRARVEQLGGTLDIRCEGVGTEVVATIPAQ